MTQPKIHVASDLNSFFEDQVGTTARKQGVEMSPLASRYLASVLAKFSDTRNLLVENPNEPIKPGREPSKSFPTLAIMWLESHSNPPAEQYIKLQQLGDVALFTAGFFGDRLNRTALDLDYYSAMGGRAYERAGQLRDALAAEKAVNVFFELASNFNDFVEVFAELSDRAALTNDKDVLRLYEKWLRTGSGRISRMLGEAGVIANPGTGRGPAGSDDNLS